MARYLIIPELQQQLEGQLTSYFSLRQGLSSTGPQKNARNMTAVSEGCQICSK